MSYFHLIFGLLLFVVFTITGRYMRTDFPDKDAIPPELRVLMRSRHIYILLSSIVHIGIGIYVQLRPQIWQRATQIAGSVILTASSVLLVWAFVVETYQLQGFSQLSRNGLYSALWGISMHLIGGFQYRKTRA